MGWMEDASTVPELKDAGLKEKRPAVWRDQILGWLPR